MAAIVMIGLGVFPCRGLAKQVHRAESKVEVSADGSAGSTTNRIFEVISHHAEKRSRF